MSGFASIDGTGGINNKGEPVEFTGIFRKQDQFGRLYFEIRTETFNDLNNDDLDSEDDTVKKAFYFDTYWNVPMARGKLGKELNLSKTVKAMDNGLEWHLTGTITPMNGEVKLKGKSYSGEYLTINTFEQVTKQNKDVLAAAKNHKPSDPIPVVKSAGRNTKKASSTKSKSKTGKTAAKSVKKAIEDMDDEDEKEDAE